MLGKRGGVYENSLSRLCSCRLGFFLGWDLPGIAHLTAMKGKLQKFQSPSSHNSAWLYQEEAKSPVFKRGAKLKKGLALTIEET